MSAIKFIGTGSGKVLLNRFHSSFILIHNNFNLLVDAGDGISKALLRQKISFNEIDGIIITHLHPDHFSGLASLIVQMKMINRTKDLKIFVHEELIGIVKEFFYFSYLFEQKMDFKIHYETFKENSILKILDGFEIIARQNSHLDEYKIFDEKKKLSFSCSSILFKIGNKNIFYTGDIGNRKDLLLFKDFKIELMIVEVSHYHLNHLIEVYDSIKPKKICLTHIGEYDEEKIIEFLNSQNPVLMEEFIITKDGYQIDF